MDDFFLRSMVCSRLLLSPLVAALLYQLQLGHRRLLPHGARQEHVRCRRLRGIPSGSVIGTWTRC